MKTWFGLLLTVGVLMVGCASGDYARRPAYEERPAASGDRRMWYQNPETDAEQANRIWSEESRR
jgi:hypothetical protein